jgi:HSP20 family protein
MASTTAAKKSETNEAKAGAAQGMQRAEDHPFFLGRMRDEFDRMFHRFTRNFPSLWEMGGNNWRWGVEVEEKDDALIVKAEAPGFEFSDFDIRVENRRLVMKASRKSEIKEKDGKKIEERECYQSITLPCDVNRDKAEATYHNGVLIVTMPKAADATGRQIPVQGI